MSRIGKYYYDKQLKRYALQFNAIFGGMVVSTGKAEHREESYIKVPIVYGSMDRVAAAMATGHTQNKHIRLPMMSTNIVNYDIAHDRMKGIGHVNRDVYVPSGGMVPDDAKVIYRRMSTPYDLTFDLHIYASNKDQLFQIIEQIMIIFNPSISIQTSDSHFDETRISTVELVSINNEENFPPGTESRTLMTTIQFKVDAYISVPADVRDNIVHEVRARVMAVSDGNIGTIHSDGINNNDIGHIFDELEVQSDVLSSTQLNDE